MSNFTLFEANSTYYLNFSMFFITFFQTQRYWHVKAYHSQCTSFQHEKHYGRTFWWIKTIIIYIFYRIHNHFYNHQWYFRYLTLIVFFDPYNRQNVYFLFGTHHHKNILFIIEVKSTPALINKLLVTWLVKVKVEDIFFFNI